MHEALNRETGAKPVLSRSCNAEQALIMSLGNREGKASDEAEPEELPDLDAVKFCERRKRRMQGIIRPVCILQTGFLF